MERLKALLEEDERREAEREALAGVVSEMEELEVIANSIQEALEIGAKELGVSIAELDYEVLEKGSNGFLGIFGKKPWRVLVKRVESFGSGAVLGGDAGFDLEVGPSAPLNRDGEFKIRVTKHGVMLKVIPPSGDGKPVKFDDIQQELLKREIFKVDETKIKQEVENPSGEWVKIGDWTPNPEYDSKAKIEITPDEMRVFVTVTKPIKSGRMLDEDDIIAILRQNGIVYGIKEDAIKEMVEKEIFDIPVLVAEGDRAENGKDAWIEYFFKADKDEVKFAVSDNGRVDFHKLDLIQNVVAGQVLAKKHPATPGKPGKTVRGKIIPARPGRDVNLVPGKNTHLSEDGLELIADINGQVVVKNNKINVEPVYEVDGDVDLNTGDIEFPGNVRVRGSVKDTFAVKAGGNVEVWGTVEKATIEAEGDVVVKRGIQGKDGGIVKAGGDLYARFIERANVRVKGDVIVQEVILHSHVDAGRRIICIGKKAAIIGGKVRAREEINVKNLGAEAYTETHVEVGVDPDVQDRLDELNKRKGELENRSIELQKELATLSLMLAKGPLPPEKEERFNQLNEENKEIAKELREIQKELEEIEQYLAQIEENARISVSKIVYPGVIIKIKSAILRVRDEFKYVSFIKDGPDIRVIPYEELKLEKDKMKKFQKGIR